MSAPLFSHPGEIDSGVCGWELMHPSACKGFAKQFETGSEPAGGRLQSRVLQLKKPEGQPGYFRLRFRARSAVPAYWWVDLWDGRGKPLPDVNSAIEPGPEWQGHEQMLYLQPAAVGAQVAFEFNGDFAVRDLTFEQATRDEAAAWCDALYAALPSLEFRAPSGAFELLPRSSRALRQGDPWRIVLLGDSIQNDTFNSVFQALVERDLPVSQPHFIASVRGATGCWFYRHPENFAEYVARHHPDLLLIGGVSNLREDQDDPTAAMAKVREVVNRAVDLGSEVVLLSPPFSRDWRQPDPSKPTENLPVSAWDETVPVEPDGTPRQWSPFAGLAGACEIAFWNMTVPTMQYVAASGMPHGFFNRNSGHSNDRGKQILGRTLHQYFLSAAAV